MDKPIKMSVKDYLIRLLSIKTNQPVKTIEAIIDHQFQGANDAMRANQSVEISGFGKFLFNTKKAQKKLEKQYSKENTFRNILERPDLTEAKRKSVQLKLDNTIKMKEWLTLRLKKDEQAV